VMSAPGFYAELAREFGVPYESEIVTSVLRAADMKADPIHPNARGYRKMAEALAQLLREAGAL
jgi:acyl-CoA thioesterase-1